MNLLITGAWSQASDYFNLIQRAGHKIAYMPWEGDSLPCSVDWPEGIIGNNIFTYHPIEDFCRLRYIQLTSVGYDRIPLKYITDHGIIIHNAKDVYSIPMAEYAVGGVLWIYKQMDFFVENQNQRKWQKNMQVRELYGKVVLILGCGSVGKACASRFRCFGCDVHGITNRAILESELAYIHPFSDLDTLLPIADIVIIALPLTDETLGVMDEWRLRMLKEDAVLVNISRGKIIDENALCSRIQSIGGAVLDVFEEEPLPSESPLWSAPNVLVTPHNSFAGEGNGERLSAVIINNLKSEKLK